MTWGRVHLRDVKDSAGQPDRSRPQPAPSAAAGSPDQERNMPAGPSLDRQQRRGPAVTWTRPRSHESYLQKPCSLSLGTVPRRPDHHVPGPGLSPQSANPRPRPSAPPRPSGSSHLLPLPPTTGPSHTDCRCWTGLLAQPRVPVHPARKSWGQAGPVPAPDAHQFLAGPGRSQQPARWEQIPQSN